MGVGSCCIRFGFKLEATGIPFLRLFLPLAAASLPRAASVSLLLFGVTSAIRTKLVLIHRCYGGAEAKVARSHLGPHPQT